MTRSRQWLLIAGLCAASLLGVARPGFTSEALVPDDFPTIAQAIASGADTVTVRTGSYPESLVISRKLVLRGACTDCIYGPKSDRPVIASVSVGSGATDTELLSLHVSGLAVVACLDGRVNGCAFDSGFSHNGGGAFKFDSCQVRGDLTVHGDYGTEVGWNAIFGGSVGVGGGNQGLKYVHDNVITGPAPYGIGTGDDCDVANNTVRGCVDGILMRCDQNSAVVGNLVENVSETGYLLSCPSGGYGSPYVHGNIARRCRARGFDFDGNCSVLDGNEADSCGQEGMLLRAFVYALTNNLVIGSGGTGISAGAGVGSSNNYKVWFARGNRVLGAGGDGIAIGWSDSISDNIVGRCRGGGIVVQESPDLGVQVHHNTSYSNGGPGIALVGGSSSDVDSIYDNVSVDNQVGLAWSIDQNLPPTLSPATPRLSCNDWYGNTAGNVQGTSSSPTDLSLDPLFCDIAHDDVTLGSASPLANMPGCGQIGARGVGCTGPAAVAVGGPPEAQGLRVSPQPGHGAMRFSWAPAARQARIALYDVAGARRWSATVPAGETGLQWSGAGDDGRPLPAGVYFAQLLRGGVRSGARVVILK